MDRRGCKAAAQQAIRDAAYSTKKVTLVCLLSIVALVAAELGLSLLIDRTTASGHYLSQTISAGTRSYVLTFLVSIVCQLVLVLILMGYTAFSLRLSRREPFSLDVLLEGFRQWGRTILLYLLVSLMLSLWASIFSMPVSYLLSALYLGELIDESAMLQLLLGYMSLVMLIVSYRYRMAQFVLLDRPDCSVRQILAEAKALNRIHRFRLFLLDLSFLPWLLLSVLTCGILLIWKLPYITATYAHAYQSMRMDYERRQKQLQDFLDAQQNRPM